jgi:hypothetical protein
VALCGRDNVMQFMMRLSCWRVLVAGRGRHTPGAEAPVFGWVERPKAEALGYLEARARATTRTRTTARAGCESLYIPTHREKAAMNGAPRFVAGLEKGNCNSNCSGEMRGLSLRLRLRLEGDLLGQAVLSMIRRVRSSMGGTPSQKWRMEVKMAWIGSSAARVRWSSVEPN